MPNPLTRTSRSISGESIKLAEYDDALKAYRFHFSLEPYNLSAKITSNEWAHICKNWILDQGYKVSTDRDDSDGYRSWVGQLSKGGQLVSTVFGAEEHDIIVGMAVSIDELQKYKGEGN